MPTRWRTTKNDANPQARPVARSACDRLLVLKKSWKPEKPERLSFRRQCGPLKRTRWSDRGATT
jgi:hypothetical protein